METLFRNGNIATAAAGAAFDVSLAGLAALAVLIAAADGNTQTDQVGFVIDITNFEGVDSEATVSGFLFLSYVFRILSSGFKAGRLLMRIDIVSGCFFCLS